MTLGPPIGSDMWLGIVRPTDVEAMDYLGYSRSFRSMLHFSGFGFNMRNPPLNDVNFRHALAHLVPKEQIMNLFEDGETCTALKLDTPVPPTQGLWYNAHTDPHPYSPVEAEAILAAADYQKIDGIWKMPDSSDIPNLRVYIPPEIVSPTSYTIGRMFVYESCAIGLTSVILKPIDFAVISLEPIDFATYTNMVFDMWNFDIFWGCWNLGRFPTHLYSFFHSQNNFLGSSNCYGINYPALDAEIETFYYGLDHPAKVAAAKRCQELIMGGTTTDPLAKPAQPKREQAIPLIPVYSQNAYDIMYDDDMGTSDSSDDEGLRGGINMFGYGINNGWTYMNIHWNTPTGNRPGTTYNMVVPILHDFPESLNPMSARTIYAWNVMDLIFDGLMATNPYTHTNDPWLASSWSYGVEAGGMYITYDIRTTDLHDQPIKWQDGVPISPSDAQFAWDFLADHEISRYWDDMKYYLGADIVGNEITAHMSTTSQWLMYALAGTAFMFPPAVWSPWVGQPKSLIEAWDPSFEAGPGGLPTKVYGTGPFILQHSTLHVVNDGYGDLDANRNYWITTQDIIEFIADQFHCAGDVDYLGEVNIIASMAIQLAMWTVPGDSDWYMNADVCGPGGTPPDDYVGIDDLGTCGKFYGEPRTVPRE